MMENEDIIIEIVGEKRCGMSYNALSLNEWVKKTISKKVRGANDAK